MKIIKINITNFGKFSNFEYVFNDGLTSIKQDNGYGKTTLLSFIAAMFYSLDNYKSSSKFNDRIHYYPFQGGLYGGSIELIYNNDNYKIIRHFDQKSQTKDILKVYKNDNFDPLLSKEENTYLGQYFFGIDKESFFKLLFITSDEIKIESNGSITNKLSNVLKGYDNVNNNSIDDGLKLLEEYKKEYKPARKSNTNIGKINQLKEEINNIEKQIENINNVKNNLLNQYIENKQFEQNILDLQNKLKLKEQLIKKENINRQYQELLKKQELYQNNILNINNKYQSGLPLKEDIEKINNYLNDNKTLNETITKLDDNKIDEYEQLKKDIKDISLVNDNNINDIIRHDENIKNLNNSKQIINQQKQQLIDNNQKIINRFDKYKEDINDDLLFLKNVSSKKIPVYVYYLLAIIFSLVTICGIGLIFLNFLVGIIITICFGVATIITLLLRIILVNKNHHNIDKKSILNKYGYDSKNDIDVLINQIENDYRQYENIKLIIKSEDDELNIIDNKLNSSYQDIIILLSSFYQNVNKDNYQTLLNNLKKINDINKNKIYFDNVNKNIFDKITDNKNKIDNILNKYHIKINDIDNIKNDINLYNDNQTLLNNINEEIKQYCLKNDISNLNNFNQEQLDLLNDNHLDEKLKQLSSLQGQLKKEINNNEDLVDNLGGLICDLDNKKELLKQYEHNYYLISYSIDCLTLANKNIIEKYITPIKDNFNKYALLLEKSFNHKIIMDSNLKISIEMDNNNYYSDDYLSSGNKAVIALCFRLALIDTMYQGSDKPFILLDDPGVQLDSEHIIKMIDLIKDISNDMQIIYLTCHDSRKTN